MSDCPRKFTKEQMIEGLKAGKTLYIDRIDAPELPELLEMQREGLVTSVVLEFDEQSTAIKFTWKKTP